MAVVAAVAALAVATWANKSPYSSARRMSACCWISVEGDADGVGESASKAAKASVTTRVAVSEAIQDLVGRLAARVNEEAEERVTAAQAKHAEQVSQHQQATAALKIEVQSTRQGVGNSHPLSSLTSSGSHSKLY